ncbi:LysM peptidoglycan-binding domain-containing protein [Serinibacter salmoneus]|uniref:LysM domain-containing protein n=1 Tax=Serinibacter salmoneus TaxID=556530 RepID=A0A2A9D0K1_9MICO|nr:LysM peptidoglycan-binding domain-containing protein [Serinibacter salmoneus]PFG19369.1 LysM domain-containing protein [Serinibacter salmoneus]
MTTMTMATVTAVPPAPARGAGASIRHGARASRPGASAPAAMRLTRRGRAVFASLGVALALAVGAVAGVAVAATDGDAMVTQVHTVSAGESLWSIAAGHTQPGQDVRETISMLTELNDLASVDLMAGQQLQVPAP